MLTIALSSAILTTIATSVFFYMLRVAAKRREEALQKATAQARARRQH